MKKMVTLLICGILYPLADVYSLAGPEPGDREIIGSHISTSSTKNLPWQMALVPAGRVQMGMTPDTAYKLIGDQKNLLDIFSRCTPKITERTPADIYCDLYEITNAQWKLYLDRTEMEPSRFLVEIIWKNQPTYPEGEESLPIRNVSLVEARKFARWCGKRIPTEVEWHRAAAGDDGRIYAWGNEWDKNRCTNKRGSLAPVGSYEEGKSPFGIHDMTGSVWEWTESFFEAFQGYRPLQIRIGRQPIKSDPRFNISQYVTKGGCYYLGELANRLEVREPALPTDNLNSLGFRCVKDVQPGKTMLLYALDDLKGSMITDKEFDERNLYAMEITELTDSEPKLISGFKSMLICPMGKSLTTTAKITSDSPDTPFPIGVLSINVPLEEPNLPPGSYVLAYRAAGLSEAEQKAALEQAEAEKKKKEEAEAKKKSEAEAKKEKEKKEKDKKKDGEQEKPKTQEEIEAEKRRLQEEEEARKDEELKRKQDEAARRELERYGLVGKTKEHVPFPRDKNLIVFMNANDTIVGYLEVPGFTEETTTVPIRVNHSPDTGLTGVELGVSVLGGRNPRFNFNVKVKDNPF